MAKRSGIFNKGSILPVILETEAELIERENEALKNAEETMRQAQISAKKLIDKTLKELPVIEEEGRARLLDIVDSQTEELIKNEEKILNKLKKNIEKNCRNALEHILNKVIPQWDGYYPE
ncbi:MAG: hypothetical protein JXB48_19685 [Candidatus Latescibacteria bacterium]|nr:hypothetical protein [Candidatus Latescibacterota bacterium]